MPPPRAELDTSMESLIHHFKLYTEGYHPPVGEAYGCVEGSKGELGFYVVSDGSNRPYRWHERGSSFTNLKSMEVMSVGRLLGSVRFGDADAPGTDNYFQKEKLGSRDLSIQTPDRTPVLETKVDIPKGGTLTLVALGAKGHYRAVVVPDEPREVDSTKAIITPVAVELASGLIYALRSDSGKTIDLGQLSSTKVGKGVEVEPGV